MNDEERIHLSKLISTYDTEDTTSKIRTLRHSKPIMEAVIGIQRMKKQYDRIRKDNFKYFEEIAISKFNFLYSHYSDIFTRLLKDEIDINILSKLLMVLSYIEESKLDQHEASYQVGLLLKQLYIDPTLDAATQTADETKRKPKHDISWNEYK